MAKKKSAKKAKAKSSATKKAAAPKKKKLVAAKAPATKKKGKKAAPKKLAAKPKAAPKKQAAPKRKPAAKPRAKRSEDEAFIRGGARSNDALAEELGEEWVQTATSGEDEAEERFSQEVPEDRGGPFVVTTGGQEFAEGVDESNPKGSKREPFPRT